MRARKLDDTNSLRVARLYAFSRGASKEDAADFATRTINEFLSRGCLAADGTCIDTGGGGISLTDALEVEFELQAVTGESESERTAYAEGLKAKQIANFWK